MSLARSLFAAGVFTLTAADASMAGDLVPPPGDITATMQGLDRIEPRRCVNDLPASPDAVHVISEPGQYFLARDIHGKFNAHGILVVCSGDVSIDLNGFSLTGVPGSLDGIHLDDGGGGGGGAGGLRAGISTSRSNLRCCKSAIVSFDGDGVDAPSCDSLEVGGLLIEGCGGFAATAAARQGIVHRDIAARNCLLGGLRSASIGEGSFGSVYRGFERCTVEDCGGNGIWVDTPFIDIEIEVGECRATGCTGDGVRLATPGGAGSGGRIAIRSIVSSNNGGDGVHLTIPANGGVVCGETSHLFCANNGDDGFDCAVSPPGAPHEGPLFRLDECNFSGNGGHGLRSENPLYLGDSTLSSNALYGAHITMPSPFLMAATMESCVSTRNAAGGVRIPRGRFCPTFCQISDEGGNGITIDDGCLVMTDSSVHRCAGHGVEVHGTINAQGSSFRRNDGYGMRGWQGTMVAIKCAMELNGGGGSGGGAAFTDCTAVTLDACVFNDNTGNGVTCSSGAGPTRFTASECIASTNTGNGFDLDHCAGGRLSGARTTGQNGRGIVCRPGFTGGAIERCASTGDAGGVHVMGTGNLIRACSAGNGPLGAFMFAQGNAAGPIIDAANLASSCSPHANVHY